MASCARASRLLFSLWLLSSRVMAQSLSAVMLRRSAELGLRPGWALSNARMPKYPGCSWHRAVGRYSLHAGAPRREDTGVRRKNRSRAGGLQEGAHEGRSGDL